MSSEAHIPCASSAIAGGAFRGTGAAPLEDQTVLENEISCLKLALPAAFHQHPGHLPLENGAAANNSIIGTHIFLSAASHMIFVLSTIRDDRSATSQERDDELACENFRVVELSSILRMLFFITVQRTSVSLTISANDFSPRSIKLYATSQP